MISNKFEKMIMYKIKPTLSEKEFLKKIILELVHDDSVPSDIFDLTFNKVELNYKRVLLGVEEKVTTKYRGSIGYNKLDEYWIKEEKKCSDKKKYFVDVKETRTITDWQPYEGEDTYNFVSYCDNINGYNAHIAFNLNIEASMNSRCYGEEYARAILELIDSEELEVEEIKLNNSDKTISHLDETFSICERIICDDLKEYYNNILPGDEKNLRYTQEVLEVNKIVCYKIPEFSVNYIYNGNEYKCLMEALPSATIYYDIPKEEKTNTSEQEMEKNEFILELKSNIIKESEKERIKQETKNKTNKLYKLMKISWVLAYSSLVGSFVLCFLNFYLGWLVAATLIAFAANNHIRYDKEFYSVYLGLIRNSIFGKRTRKIEKLANALERNGLEELNLEEYREIEDYVEEGNQEIVNNPREISNIKILLKIALLLLIIILIFSTLKLRNDVYKDCDI